MIKNWIRRYKKHRVEAAVQQYAACMHDQMALMAPIITALHAGLAQHIINQTYSNPEPAHKLVEGLKECIQLYGPGLKDVFKSFELEMAGINDYMKPAIEELANCIKRVTSDANAT